MGPAPTQKPLFQHPREHRTGANPLPFPATPQDSSSYRPDNLRWHRSQLSTDLMIFQVLTLSITIFLQDRSHNNRHTLQHHRHLPIQHKPLSWVDWKKNLTDNETSTAWSRCTSSCDQTPHTSNTLTNNEFVPLASPVESRVYESRSTYSARQVNSVASASSSPRVQPIQLDPSPGRMRQHLKVPSTTPPTLLHLQHDFLDT